MKSAIPGHEKKERGGLANWYRDIFLSCPPTRALRDEMTNCRYTHSHSENPPIIKVLRCVTCTMPKEIAEAPSVKFISENHSQISTKWIDIKHTWTSFTVWRLPQNRRRESQLTYLKKKKMPSNFFPDTGYPKTNKYEEHTKKTKGMTLQSSDLL